MTTAADSHATPPDESHIDHGHQGGSAHHHDHKHHPMYHVSSVSGMVAVWVILMVLTFLTVWVADHGHLGQWDILVAMIIATVKAILVGAFFMHLAYDRPFNAFLLIASVAFVALFIGIALLDSMEYQPEIRAYSTDSLPP